MPASKHNPTEASARVAAAVQEACLEAALQAYEDARMRGLCAEGAWEAAVGAMRSLKIERVADEAIENPQSNIQN